MTRDTAAGPFVTPDPLQLAFEGFDEEAFRILDRLKSEPHIGQYRKEKEAIRTYLSEPFKRYRDDLVVNWVIPNRLDFETERNVFSRLLKNDFGAGGCHHHLWMAFYRPGLKRLTDVQLSHGIHTDGFAVGLFVGGYARDALGQALDRLRLHSDEALDVLNELIRRGYVMRYRLRGKPHETHLIEAPMRTLPDTADRFSDLWVRMRFPRHDVVAWGGGLVRHSLVALGELWPLYRMFVEDPGEAA